VRGLAEQERSLCKMQTTQVIMGTPLYPSNDTIGQPVAMAAAPPQPLPQPPRPNLQRRQTMMNALKEMGWPTGLTQ